MTVEVTIKVNGQEMTREEAEELYHALGKELGFEPVKVVEYLPSPHQIPAKSYTVPEHWPLPQPTWVGDSPSGFPPGTVIS